MLLVRRERNESSPSDCRKEERSYKTPRERLHWEVGNAPNVFSLHGPRIRRRLFAFRLQGDGEFTNSAPQFLLVESSKTEL